MNPVTETPEVQAARAAHEKAWAAAAAAARINPDPMSDIYNANSNKLDEEQSEADQAMEIISGVSNQQSLARYPNLPYTNQIKEDDKEDEEGAFSHDSVVIETNGEGRDIKKRAEIHLENEEEEEPTNPRGFFYNFDYPVQLILENTDDRQQRSIAGEQKSKKSSKNDESELNSSLEAEVADYKIVKRSENSKDVTPITHGVEEEILSSDNNIKKDDQAKTVEKEKVKEEPQTKRVEAQIPVIVKVESENQPSDFLPKSETELRRLATNEEVIDAIHDVQVHRRPDA